MAVGGKREGKRGRVVVVVVVVGGVVVVVVGVAVDGNSVDDATGYFGVNPLSL